MKKFQVAAVAFTVTLLVPVLSKAVETSPYQYDPRQGRCLNRQGLPGLKNGHRGECGDLWGADMKNSDLKNADLSGANLSRADLSGADLTGANLSGATLLLTKIKDIKLEGAIFNERTVLPFSRKEAEKRGMQFVSRKEALKPVTPAPGRPGSSG
jgi:hypothetical protein